MDFFLNPNFKISSQNGSFEVKFGYFLGAIGSYYVRTYSAVLLSRNKAWTEHCTQPTYFTKTGMRAQCRVITVVEFLA